MLVLGLFTDPDTEVLFLVNNIQLWNSDTANMSYGFKDLDHDFNEFKMSYFRADSSKQDH